MKPLARLKTYVPLGYLFALFCSLVLDSKAEFSCYGLKAYYTSSCFFVSMMDPNLPKHGFQDFDNMFHHQVIVSNHTARNLLCI